MFRPSALLARSGIAVVCVLLIPQLVAAQLEVDQLELYLRPGVGAVATFTVRNTTESALSAQLTFNDWLRDEDGTNRFSDSGTVAQSCAAQLRLFPSTIRLDPNQAQSVQVRYLGGPLTTSCWSSIRVAATPRSDAPAPGAQLVLTIEHQVKVFVEPRDARPALTLLDVDIQPHVPVGDEPRADTAAHDIVVRASNPGVIQSRVKGRIEYRTLTDSVVARAAVDEFRLLPGATRTSRTRLAALPPGRYVILILLDYGGPELVAGQIDLDLSR
jgi:hypothetical protein